MLTPRFELSQTDNEITINIRAPYANIKDTEVYVEKDDFRFFSSPYYLRLKLPGEIVENDSSSGSYDCDAGTFVLKFDKVIKGEYFENLDMITTLLAPPRESKNIVPTIEVIGNPTATDDVDANSNDGDIEEHNWYIPQSVEPSNTNTLHHAPKYGFANKLKGALGSFEVGWLKEVVNLPDPDQTPMNERKSLREAAEFQDFNDHHYMMDFIEPEDNIKPIINFIPEWYNLTSNNIKLTDREKDILKELPNKEFLLDNDEIQTIIFGMVDILFGFCYTHRISMGEYTVESSWDINKISATLSWFENYSTMEEVVITSIRRSLCYPLYRNWELTMKVFEDVKRIIKLGKKYILKCFCEIYELFNNSYEPRYVLNQLYIRDYLIYLQQAPDSSIESITEILESIKPTKDKINLNLIDIETTVSIFYKHAKSDSKNHCPEYFINSIVDEVDKLVLNDENSSGFNSVPNNSNSINDMTFGNNISRQSNSSLNSSGSSSSSSSSSSGSSTTSSSSSSSTTSSSNSSATTTSTCRRSGCECRDSTTTDTDNDNDSSTKFKKVNNVDLDSDDLSD